MITKEVKLIAAIAIIGLLTALYLIIDSRAYNRGYQAAENKALKKDKAELETTVEETAAATLEVTAETEKTAEINNKSENIKYVYITKRVPVPADNSKPCNTFELNSLYNDFAKEQNAL